MDNLSKYILLSYIWSFKKFKTISWNVKKLDKYSVGDIVYLYLIEPFKLIKFKCKIVDLVDRKKDDKWIDDKKYCFGGKLNKSNYFINIKLVKEIKNNNITLEKLEKHGYKFNQTSPRELSDEAVKLIEKNI